MNTTKPEQTNQSIPSSLNSSWLKTFSIGFSIISFGITIAIVGYIVLTTKQNQTANQQPTTTSPTIPQPSPTPIDETANWNTYRNQTYGFSIQYPNTLEYKQVIESSSMDISYLSTIQFTNKNDLSEFPNIIFIRIFNRDTDSSLDKVQKAYFTTQSTQWKEITIGRYKGKYIEATGGALSGIAAFLEVNDKIFYFHLANRFDDKYISSQLFDQILSTFKFTQ